MNVKTLTTYTIYCFNTNNTQCFTDANYISGISSSESMHTLSNLQEATRYNITVSLLWNNATISEDTVLAATKVADEYFA